MSQTSLRRAKVGELVWATLEGENGFRQVVASGRTEREAVDAAERRWHVEFGRAGGKPSRKTVYVSRAG